MKNDDSTTNYMIFKDAPCAAGQKTKVCGDLKGSYVVNKQLAIKGVEHSFYEGGTPNLGFAVPDNPRFDVFMDQFLKAAENHRDMYRDATCKFDFNRVNTVSQSKFGIIAASYWLTMTCTSNTPKRWYTLIFNGWDYTDGAKSFTIREGIATP